MNKAISLLRQVKGTTTASLILFILMAIFADGFVSAYSVSVIMKNTSILVMAAFGMTMTIILAKIDISIGSVMSFASVITALGINSGMPLIVAMLLGVLSGALIGAFNGVCIAYCGFNYWLVTFATLGIAKGVALGITNGSTISKLSDQFELLGNGDFLGVYYITWITLFFGIFVWFLTRKTKYGYNLYSVGNSASVADVSGIDTKKVTLQTYIFSGAFAAVAGILLAAKSNAANPIIGDPYSFNAIAACIIGGTPFVGGKGGILGTILGAFLLTSLTHGLGLLGYSSLYQMVILGSFIMAIIIADVMRENKKEREDKRRVFHE